MSCSSKNKTKNSYEYDAEKKIDIPAWVYDINSECDTRAYLCASSEGESLEEADLNSKKTLASILELKVNSNSEIKRFGLINLESKGLQENIKIKVQEEVDMILNGVKVIKRFKKNDSYYSYSILDKKVALKVLKDKVKSLDSKMVSLYSQKRRVYVNRLLSLLSQRKAFESEITVLDGNVKKAPLTYDNIYYLKKKNTYSKKLHVKLLDSIPPHLLKKIEEELISLGFILTKSEANYILKVNFSLKEEYLNVKGFRKFSFHLTIGSFDKKLSKRGVVSISKVSTGRTKGDALSTVIEEIASKVKIDIDKLNI